MFERFSSRPFVSMASAVSLTKMAERLAAAVAGGQAGFQVGQSGSGVLQKNLEQFFVEIAVITSAGESVFEIDGTRCLE